MSRFAGTAPLARLAVRRDRLRLPLWLLGIGGIVYLSGAAVAGVYGDPVSIAGYGQLVGSSPVAVAMSGPPIALDTLAGIVIYEIQLTAILGVALMAITMVSRHARAEEESGRTELVRATEVGRHAGSAAALLVTSAACVVLGGLLWLALLPTALSAGQSAVFGLGIALLGVAMAGTTLALAQLFVHARTVTGSALGVFAVGYVLRAAGDVREDWLVWLSPVGWVQATRAAGDHRWWPLVLPVLLAGAGVAVAVLLAERRDFGGGLLPTRSGPRYAPRTLVGPVTLGLRVQRPALLGWSAGILFLAVLTGTLGEAVQDMVDSNPMMADYLAVTQGGTVVDAYLSTMVLILALVAGGYAVWAAGHPGAGEDAGQLDLVLAAPVSRVRSLVSGLVVTSTGATLLLVVSGVGLGTAHGVATGDAGEGVRAALAQLAYLPAVLTLVGLVVLIDGWRPRWTGVGWVVLAFYAVIGWLGGLLQPPGWVTDLSTFSQTPFVPLESAAGAALPVLTALAVALMTLGAVGFRRRDVG